ncbi:MAG: hypothetical protein ACREYE_23850 [Gammaproteobacteria bacterium]
MTLAESDANRGARGCWSVLSSPVEHVWKEQTDAIKKAKEINRVIESQADEQRQAIENQSR